MLRQRHFWSSFSLSSSVSTAELVLLIDYMREIYATCHTHVPNR
jgi:hypothetical protein